MNFSFLLESVSFDQRKQFRQMNIIDFRSTKFSIFPSRESFDERKFNAWTFKKKKIALLSGRFLRRFQSEFLIEVA